MWRGECEHAHWMFTSRFNDGFSIGNYSDFNVATHVGDSLPSVQKNRNRIAEMMNVSPDAIFWPELTHSTLSLQIKGKNQSVKPADIIYTTNSEIALATMSADCVPLIAISHKEPFTLAAHIGWKGAAANIANEIVAIFESQDLTEVEIVLGPAICGACYQVPHDRLQQVEEALPGSRQKGGLDLRAGLSRFFEDRGFRVEILGPCTYETDELFSYRRDPDTGRQAAVVKIR